MSYLKHKGLIITALIFFLSVNTTYYWEGKLGFFAMLTFIALILVYLYLTFALLEQLFLFVKEKFRSRYRLFIIALLATILVLSFLYPYGLVNFEKYQSKAILVAQREGVANCMTTVKLRENKKFIRESICFGIEETTGEYIIKDDTIFFENTEYFKFGIIRPEKRGEKIIGTLVIFKSNSDSTGLPLKIIKDDLKIVENLLAKNLSKSI